VGAAEVGHEPFHFIATHDGWFTDGTLRANDATEVAHVAFQDMFVEEHKSVERLVLGTGGNVGVCSEMGQKRYDLWSTHIFGMAHVVEDDKPSGPVNIGVFGADGVVAESDFVANLVEEFRAL
jgi:hypothetical protein